jgi:PAS domain S-box-containing protein
MDSTSGPISDAILDAIGDGVYVCDRDRRILFWSKGAERITGWAAEEVVGRQCLDNVLAHSDKDGHRLCGREYCPLHRSMVTDSASTAPLIVYAKGRNGGRIPMQVTVSPLRNEAGEVIGGVESFRDMTSVVAEMERAKKIQALSLEKDLPADERIAFATFYTPHDIVGGDYFAIRPIDADSYGFILADVMGHGVAAALHTMYLSLLWTRHQALLSSPSAFAAAVNAELETAVKGESFATALCGRIDLASHTLLLASAGGPPVVIFRQDGSVDRIEPPGMPLGVLDCASYDEVATPLNPGDTLLTFSDGAFEIHDAADHMLGVDGLIALLQSLGYPHSGPFPIRKVEEFLLRHSNAIRLLDDLTFIEARLTAG